jgi:hypothetical protein
MAPVPALEDTTISKPKPADLIPGYQLQRLLGRGGMGEVYLAVQLSLERKVAVKLLPSDLATDEVFVARFEKEAAALASLSHPNIVAIVDKGCAQSTYYLVMEYIDGKSMREVMRAPQFDAATAVKMVVDVARAVDYAHSKGVIHRDLKPENILFDEQAGGIAKVTDFGLAGFVDDASGRFNVTEADVSMGTLSYMAPEQRVDAKKVDHRADIYSLGVILYELLVGEVPAGNFDSPSQRKPGLDRRLDAIVGRCLRSSPADRYARASELIADLMPLAPASFSSMPRRAGIIERASASIRRSFRKGARLIQLALVLAAVAVVGAQLLRGDARPVGPAGPAMAGELGDRAQLAVRGRIDPPQKKRRVVLGEGAETVALSTFGRKATSRDGAISFGAATDTLSGLKRLLGRGEGAGRAEVDAPVSGPLSTSLSATVELSPARTGPAALVRKVFAGSPPPGRSALLLLGTSGRYIAVVASTGGLPPSLEWSLGPDRQGVMTSTGAEERGASSCELVIDGRTGKASAYVGSGSARRLVGEPLDLGADWQRLFGGPPRAALGCVDAECTFRGVRVSAESGP